MAIAPGARGFLSALNQRGRMYLNQGNLKSLDRRIAKFGDSANRSTLSPKAQGSYQDLVSRRAAHSGKYNQYSRNWNQYVNSVDPSKRKWAHLAGNVTGMAYDTPRALSFMPTSNMGAVPGIAAYTVGGSLMPSSRAGDLAFNAFGNPAGHVQQGFESGAMDAAGVTLDAFRNSSYGQRRSMVNQGGFLGQYPDLVDPRTVAGFSGGGFGGPGIGRTLLSGKSSPEFYHRQAMQKVNPYLDQYLGNRVKSGHVKSAAFWRGMWSSARRAFDPRRAFATRAYKNRTALGVKPYGKSWNPRLHSAVNHWGMPAALTGGLGYMGYNDARNSAQAGGYQAGQDTALYGIQQGLQQMPQWKRELAAMFPEQASSMAVGKLNSLRNGAGQKASNAFGGPHGNDRIGYAFTEADGNVVF